MTATAPRIIRAPLCDPLAYGFHRGARTLVVAPQRRRASCAMAAHALALAFRQAPHDQADAARMAAFVRSRETVRQGARLMLLSGLAGGAR